MIKPTIITADNADQIAEEAAHAAFAVLCQHLDPECKHDLGGLFALNNEQEFESIQEMLRSALINAQTHLRNRNA